MKNKRYVLSAILIAFIGQLCAAKAAAVNDDTLKHKALYIIKFPDKSIMVTENNFLDPMVEDSVIVISDLNSKVIRNLFKVDYLFSVVIKHDAHILTLCDFFTLFRIQEKYRKALIKVDDDLINHPETMLISKNQIDNVKVIKTPRGVYIKIILKSYYDLKRKYPNGEPFRIN